MNDSKSPREEPATAGQAVDASSDLGRETDREILEILADESPLDVMDLAKIADRHPITVDQTCTRLYEQELIYPISRGRYDVTDSGLDRISDDADVIEG